MVTEQILIVVRIAPLPLRFVPTAPRKAHGRKSDMADLETCEAEHNDRLVVRCKHCGLRQYMTRDSNCRKCHMSLVREVPKDVSPEPKPQPRMEVLTWGKALAKLREQNGMTQTQFAAKAGIMRTHLCKIENSQWIPTYATVVRLATAL